MQYKKKLDTCMFVHTYVRRKRGEHCIRKGSTARSTGAYINAAKVGTVHTAKTGKRSAARKGSTTSMRSTARQGIKERSTAREGTTATMGTTKSVENTPGMNSSVAK